MCLINIREFQTTFCILFLWEIRKVGVDSSETLRKPGCSEHSREPRSRASRGSEITISGELSLILPAMLLFSELGEIGFGWQKFFPNFRTSKGLKLPNYIGLDGSMYIYV